MINKPESRRIHFKRITAKTVSQICALSNTLSIDQRKMVADNASSIAEAHFSEDVWMRAIYLDEEPIGFLMVHYGSDYDDGIDCPGAFLWRFMIAGPWQGKGYGQEAIQFLVEHLIARGYHELYTSAGEGQASPVEFYKRLGFCLTGGYYGDEVELVLSW